MTPAEVESWVKNTATRTAVTITPSRIAMIGTSRSVRANAALPSPFRNAFSAIEKEPTTTGSDLMMPKMPAVAMAPTPM